MISSVPVSQIDAVWSQLKPKIDEALKHGCGDGETSDHLYQELKNETMFMLVAHEGEEVFAGGVFSVQNHPAKKTLFVELLAGKDLDSWIDEVEEALKNLKDHLGADTIEASCRKGLTRMLKNWKPKATIMELI